MIQRHLHDFVIQAPIAFKKSVLAYYQSASYLVLLDSNQSNQSYDTYSAIIAVGAKDQIICKTGTALNELSDFRKKHSDWCFGFLGYDLKNELESLESSNFDPVGFPDLCFFIPELVFEIQADKVVLHSLNADSVQAQTLFDNIQQSSFIPKISSARVGSLKAIDDRPAYLKKAKDFLAHIHRGDIYEANFCTAFYAQDVPLHTSKAFEDLNESSASPFAVYARFGRYHVISASPERYLKKTGRQLISQPIKGTAKRSLSELEDQALKQALFNDPKERSENVMIVDLVRNDLSKIALKGSVQVEELFGIYTFKQVHQMISTISATLAPDIDAIAAIKATFPMGSMTGAPKVSAMKIIEKNESFKRGLYSGAIGYFTPQDDFDFNVVIRTILYNEQEEALCIGVGSALTAAAVPEKEYEECLLKAKALIHTLALQGIVFD